MPEYQCPRCHNTFRVESNDAAATQCPHCRRVGEDNGWYVRIGGQSVGPVSREAVSEFRETKVEIRRADEEWLPAREHPEFAAASPSNADEQSEQATSEIRKRFIADAIIALLLVLVAASGWVYHFVTTNDDGEPTTATGKTNGGNTSSKSLQQQKTKARGKNQSAAPKVTGKANDAKPLKPVPVKEVRLDIQPQKNEPQRVVVSVTVNDTAVWKSLISRIPQQKLADALTLRVLSDRELKMTPNRKKVMLKRRGPDFAPLPGKIEIDGRKLLFQPDGELRSGEHYVAAFDPAKLGPGSGFPPQRIAKAYHVGPLRPRLVSIHPQTKDWPENVTRFHLVFTEPMKRESASSHIFLQEINGEERSFENVPLLWSKDGRRCTVQLQGPVLKNGSRYRLIVGAKCESTHNLPIGRDALKLITAIAADKHGPEPENWSISFPNKAEKMTGIRCKMGELVDEVSLPENARIVDDKGRRIPGKFDFFANGTGWTFHPEQEWKAGDYRFLISDQLRDPAGNAATGKFQSDPADPKAKRIVIPFRVKDK